MSGLDQQMSLTSVGPGHKCGWGEGRRRLSSLPTPALAPVQEAWRTHVVSPACKSKPHAHQAPWQTLVSRVAHTTQGRPLWVNSWREEVHQALELVQCSLGIKGRVLGTRSIVWVGAGCCVWVGMGCCCACSLDPQDTLHCEEHSWKKLL